MDIWVMDASVLINLLGSGSVETLLKALSGRLLMADRTFKEVLRDPSGRLPSPPERQSLVEAGLIRVLTLGHAAGTTFLDLVSEPYGLDDGEAATIAVALEQGAVPVLDERKGRRVYRECFSGRALESSAGLFRRIADSGALPAAVLRETLFLAVKRARMSVIAEEMDWVLHTLGQDLASQCPSLRRRR